ncbi:trehalose-6-phosphate synthase [Streptomyces sp. TRM64462]|uniref:trehalose-6-phosphate synthase n=1 Tax=Streptomyces sp. TRM64462 TaxID=2741726 RepID=UPI001586F7E1|nr:trehalose-6-phosphate synthase [Streptomyces sp. TRM64462]
MAVGTFGGGGRVAHVLVTDLDGTLLGGDEEGRRRLRGALERHPEITVVFATGRGLPSVQALLERDPLVPPPRWIVADVGATVVDAADMSHVDVLEDRLRAGWPGDERVRDALAGFPALVYQEGVAQDGRCSFYLEPRHLTPELTAAVEALGCSWTYSADRYFDVLPPRAGKGPAVRELARKLQWPASRLLVAGDSLNDLSLFRLGAHGVVVGNAEPALVERLPAGGRVHRPALEGAGAVLSALERLGWTRRAAQVVIGYHRPPVRWSGGRWRRPSSPNGILPTLTSALAGDPEGARAVWAAALVQDDPADPPGAPPAAPPAGLPLALLPVPAEHWAGYFHRACKETLWPALMSQPHLIRYDPVHWARYEAVNAAFARHIGAHAEQGGTVWLHDYNLWLVPGLLGPRRPDLRIGLFHHTPFPEPEVFARLPVAARLYGSLARLDWAGFHTESSAHRFRRVLAGAAGAFGAVGGAARGSGVPGVPGVPGVARVPRVGVHPLGIDRRAVGALARSRPARRPERDGDGRLLVLSVERLDYAKAPVQKVRAVGALLDRAPELRGRLRFRLVCPPPEPGIRAYDTTRTELERTVAAVNARWRSSGWEPVEYIPRALPFPEVVDQYVAADVFWVTSLADGMNLTAQEYVTALTATGGAGVLVLSRRTGAAEHLGAAALLTDPLSPDDLVDTLHRALAMPEAERRAHTARLAAALAAVPAPADWAAAVVADIRGGTDEL